MEDSFHTYPAGRTCGFRRLSSTLSSNWLSVRVGYADATDEAREDEDEADCPPEKTETKAIRVSAANVQTAAGMGSATEISRKEAAAEAEPKAEKPVAIVLAPKSGLNAYGCVYHKGVQRLVIAHPGDAVPIRFDAHSCLNRIGHEAGDAHAAVSEAGDYEISFDVRLSANASAPLVFELRAGDKPIPGGVFAFALSSGTRECRGGTMAHLKAGDRISLMLTSASVCQATLSASGVAAMLILKKLN